MKSTIACLLALLAVASAKNIGYIPKLPDITSQSLPFKQWHAQDAEGRANFGYFYPGQAAANVRNSNGDMAGSWAYVNPEKTLVQVSYTADQRGFLVSSINESPVKPLADAESTMSTTRKVSSKPTIAEESRCDCGCADDQARSDRKTEKGTEKVTEKGTEKVTEKVAEKVIPQPNFKMVGSEEAPRNQYPFMVALVENDGAEDDENPSYDLACGGSLITPTKILTAAHCITEEKSNKIKEAWRYQVKFGMHTLTTKSNDAQESRKVVKIKIHPEYDWKSVENDIAILTLESAVEYTDTISPICLPPACFVGDSITAVAMGWGNTKYKGEDSEVLRHANLKVVSNEDCQAIYSGKDNIRDFMMCAYTDGKDTCQNDSGGPLVVEYPEADECRFMQIGIVSYGDECAVKGKPGVYARVTSYLPWIEKQTNA